MCAWLAREGLAGDELDPALGVLRRFRSQRVGGTTLIALDSQMCEPRPRRPARAAGAARTRVGRLRRESGVDRGDRRHREKGHHRAAAPRRAPPSRAPGGAAVTCCGAAAPRGGAADGGADGAGKGGGPAARRRAARAPAALDRAPARARARRTTPSRQTELAHAERADHPDFTKPLASARVRADLVDHVAAELAKRPTSAPTRACARLGADPRVVGDAEGGEAAVPAGAAAPACSTTMRPSKRRGCPPRSQSVRSRRSCSHSCTRSRRTRAATRHRAHGRGKERRGQTGVVGERTEPRVAGAGGAFCRSLLRRRRRFPGAPVTTPPTRG